MRVLAERGWIDLDPASAYRGLRMRTSRARDKAGLTTEVPLPERDQFALAMDHMAERVARGERPHTPGGEGLQDMRVIEAIYQAAREGRPIELKVPGGKDTTRGPAPT